MRKLAFLLMVIGIALVPAVGEADDGSINVSVKGKLERIDMAHGTARVDGNVYILPSDVEAWDPVEGGPIAQSHLKVGSVVGIQLRPGKKGEAAVIEKMILLEYAP